MRYREILAEADQPTDVDPERLDRARALGFDVEEPVYHGTTAGAFASFRPRYRNGEQLGFGIHVTPDAAFAQRYATDGEVARKGKQPHLFVGYARKGHILDANSIVRDGTPEFALALKLAGPKARGMVQKNEAGVGCIYMQNAIDATSGQRAERLIRAAGYDTIRYRSRIGQRGFRGIHYTGEAPSYVILDPCNLRRVDAAFDPAQAQSDDLLA